MAYNICDMTVSDLPELFSIYFTVFASTQLYRILWPGFEANKSPHEEFFRKQLLEEPNTRFRKAIDSRTKAMVGFAVWLVFDTDPSAPPSSPPLSTQLATHKEDLKGNLTSENHEDLPEYSDFCAEAGANAAACAEFYLQLNKLLDLRSLHYFPHAREPPKIFYCYINSLVALLISLMHTELDVLTVQPAYQGRGVGTALVTDGIDHAQEQNFRAIFLTTSIMTRGFYERLGFHLCGSFEVDLSKWEENTFTETKGKRSEDIGVGEAGGKLWTQVLLRKILK